MANSAMDDDIHSRLKSFYLEEIDPKNQGHCGAATLLEHPAFNKDNNVRAIRERYKDNPEKADELLRLLIFIEYKLVQKGKPASSWFKDTLVYNPWEEEQTSNPEKEKPIKYTKDLDCNEEGSLLYRCLWPELTGKKEIDTRYANLVVRYVYTFEGATSSLKLQGDCMCSAAWPLQDGLKLFKKEHKDKIEQLMKDDNYARLLRYKAKDGTWKQGFPAGVRQYLPAIRYDMCSGNNHLERVWADPSFLAFLKESFSRANWIVVPDGMNKPRGGVPIRDYWDRSMEQVLATDDNPKRKLEKYRIAFQQLLDREWEVPGENTRKPGLQALLLDDWVYKDGDHYRPKYLQLCDEETLSSPENWDNPGPPTTLDQWKNMVEDMTHRIQERRKDMVEALVKVPTEQLTKSGLIPSSFEEEHR